MTQKRAMIAPNRGEEFLEMMTLTDMTDCDYPMVMRSVRIADLKAHLSEHLRTVRQGEVITILDRETPIARIVPHQKDNPSLVIRSKRQGATLRSVRMPPPLRMETDIVDLLLEERWSER
jgi:prevent-host-death family protein